MDGIDYDTKLDRLIEDKFGPTEPKKLTLPKGFPVLFVGSEA
jgi:hypothetical protein